MPDEVSEWCREKAREMREGAIVTQVSRVVDKLEGPPVPTQHCNDAGTDVGVLRRYDF
jgi:hypothetical protein